jgi:hypothetical protein
MEFIGFTLRPPRRNRFSPSGSRLPVEKKPFKEFSSVTKEQLEASLAMTRKFYGSNNSTSCLSATGSLYGSPPSTPRFVV